MKTATKILLSVPSCLAIIFFITTYLFPLKFYWPTPTVAHYYWQVGTINSLTLIQVLILLKKLWSFKMLEKSEKRKWTWYLILFNSMAALIFIWKRADEFDYYEQNPIA